MVVLFCDNCHVQIAADALVNGIASQADGRKTYCAKCAPLFMPADSVTKFYFCETCGKRITDKQILEGLGRDKKLKGVYCKDCAVGVMTMEFESIKDAPLLGAAKAPPGKPPSSPAGSKGSAINLTPEARSAAPGHKPGKGVLTHGATTAQRSARQSANSLAIPLAVVAVVIVSALALLFMGKDSGAHSAQTRAAALEPAQKTTMSPPAQTTSPALTPPPVPVGPKTDTSSDPSLDHPPAAPIVVAPVETPQSPAALPPAIIEKPISAQPLPAPKPVVIEPALQPVPATMPPPPAKAEDDERKKQFAAILKELAPLLRNNQIGAAEKLLDEKLRGPALVAFPEIKKERADLTDIRALRQRAIDALRARGGSTITLIIRGAKMTGAVKADSNHSDLALALPNGPEMTIKAELLDIQDVEAYAPVAADDGRAEDLRRRGLLFLAAGDVARAEDYFSKARDAGLGDAVAPYLDRIAGLKLDEREAAALDAWKKAEALLANKKWTAAKQAFEAFQREYAQSAALAGHLDTLKKHLETIEDALGPPKELSLDLGGGVKMEMVLIPAGEFEMGGSDGGASELPIHKVKITHYFFMGKYLVTQAQYKKVMAANPSGFNGESLPVESVSPHHADDFCKKVSNLTGKNCRLPTEAEWEYACRAGTKTKYNTGGNDPALDQAAWFKANSENKTHPVGQKKPNAWGLYDMHGNVGEWCADTYAEDYYSKSPAEDPRGPAPGDLRVVRGGSWGNDPIDCRASSRGGFTSALNWNYVGFRVILAAP